MLFKIGILKNFVNFTGKHLCLTFFVIKLQAVTPATLLKTDSNTGIFLWYLRTFKEHIFYRTPPVAASKDIEQQHLFEGVANSCYKIV